MPTNEIMRAWGLGHCRGYEQGSEDGAAMGLHKGKLLAYAHCMKALMEQGYDMADAAQMLQLDAETVKACEPYIPFLDPAPIDDVYF